MAKLRLQPASIDVLGGGCVGCAGCVGFVGTAGVVPTGGAVVLTGGGVVLTGGSVVLTGGGVVLTGGVMFTGGGEAGSTPAAPPLPRNDGTFAVFDGAAGAAPVPCGTAPGGRPPTSPVSRARPPQADVARPTLHTIRKMPLHEPTMTMVCPRTVSGSRWQRYGRGELVELAGEAVESVEGGASTATSSSGTFEPNRVPNRS